MRRWSAVVRGCAGGRRSSEKRQPRQVTGPLLSWWGAFPLGHRAQALLSPRLTGQRGAIRGWHPAGRTRAGPGQEPGRARWGCPVRLRLRLAADVPRWKYGVLGEGYAVRTSISERYDTADGGVPVDLTVFDTAVPRPPDVGTGTRRDGHGPDQPATDSGPWPRVEACCGSGQATAKTSPRLQRSRLQREWCTPDKT